MAKQYYSQGEYENPTAVIEYDASKVWISLGKSLADASKQITNTILDNRARQVKETLKRNQEENQNVLGDAKSQAELRDKVSKSGIQSDAYINYSNGLINSITTGRSAADQSIASKEERQKKLNELSTAQNNLNTMINGGKTIQDEARNYLSATGYITNNEKDFAVPGNTGGMAIAGQNDEVQRYHSIMQAWNGFGPSKIKEMYARDGSVYATFTGGDLEKEGEINVTQAASFDPGIIIDSKKLQKETIDNLKIFKSPGKYTDNFLSDDSLIEVIKNKEGTREYDVKPIDFNKVISTLEGPIMAQAESFIQTPGGYSDANAWWLNNAGEYLEEYKDQDKNPIPDLPYKNDFGTKVVDPEYVAKFKEAWWNQTKGLLPSFEIVGDRAVQSVSGTRATSKDASDKTTSDTQNIYKDIRTEITNNLSTALNKIDGGYNQNSIMPIVQGLTIKGSKVEEAEIKGNKLILSRTAGFSKDGGDKVQDLKEFATLNLDNIGDLQIVVDKYIKANYPDLTPKEDKQMRKDVREFLFDMRAKEDQNVLDKSYTNNKV